MEAEDLLPKHGLLRPGLEGRRCLMAPPSPGCRGALARRPATGYPDAVERRSRLAASVHEAYQGGWWQDQEGSPGCPWRG